MTDYNNLKEENEKLKGELEKMKEKLAEIHEEKNEMRLFLMKMIKNTK